MQALITIEYDGAEAKVHIENANEVHLYGAAGLLRMMADGMQMQKQVQGMMGSMGGNGKPSLAIARAMPGRGQ